ncbi:MAG: TetR/AcrR family transcriptional regulator [Bacilli bacterium]|nr:TetR/AcrR family transcriptional regulator [Bacilli bacterium]
MVNKRINKTKANISVALYALMHRKPYDEISVKEICEKAGCSRMSFYRYYSKKDDIFLDYCDERFEEFYLLFTSKGDFSIKNFTLEMFRYIKQYSRQIKTLKKANREWMLLDQLNSYAKYVMVNLKSDYLQEQKNNPMFAYFMAGGLFNVLMDWIENDFKVSPEEMNTMLHSISTI